MGERRRGEAENRRREEGKEEGRKRGRKGGAKKPTRTLR